MSQLISVDGGNHEVKVVFKGGFDCFSSAIGEYEERNAKDIHSKDDMVFHIVNQYEDIKGFAGKLATLESEFGGSIYGTSKNHQDARIRILLGIARNLRDYKVDIIVGQPYISHTDEEKKEIVNSLKGEHVVIINGKKREFLVDNVIVGIEGAMAFWCQPENGDINVIDVGSGTVNCINFFNKRIVDRKSTTLSFGTETSKNGMTNYEGISRAIFRQMSRSWNKDSKTFLCGGSSEMILTPLKTFYKNIIAIKPKLKLSSDVEMELDYKFSNAVGMLKVGERAIEQYKLQTR